MGRIRIRLTDLHGRLFAVLFALLASQLVGSAALAQTTGEILVTVTDDDGFEVPNASVTLSGETLIGGAQTRTTGDSGNARFTQIPPGSYDVNASHESLNASTVAGVQVLINQTTRVSVKMSAIEVIEAVHVEKAVNTSSTSRSSVLTKEFLQRVPTGRNYQQATSLAAGVAVGATQGGNPNIGGGATNENTYMIDGAAITDPVTGTFSANFNFDAIQQIEVLLGGYMPEYGVSLGGIVNIVTESGSNNLTFDTSVFYTNGDWRPRMDERIASDGFTIAQTGFDNTFQTININAKVSGPIIRDKAFFVLSYATERSLISVSGTPQRRDYEGHYVYGKLTVQPSADHRFTAGLQLDPTTIDNGVQGTPFIKASSQSRQTQGGFIGTGRWQWFLSPEVNLDTSFVVQKSFINSGSVPCSHNKNRDVHQCRPGELDGSIDDFTPGRIGIAGAYDSVNNVSVGFDDRWRFNYGTKLSLVNIDDPLGGTHDIKLGIEGQQLIWTRLSSINGNSVYYDTNEVTFDPTSFTNYYWVEYNSAQSQRSTGSQFNFFLQDSWKPVPNLTINYGTRFDNSVMRNDIGEPVLNVSMWGPRLHFAWDPFGDQRTKIATGYGRFNDTGRLAVASVTSQSGLGAKLYLGEFFTGSNASGFGYLSNWENNYSYNPTRNLNSAHDNLRNPYTDEFILILEREIITDFALSSSMSGKLTRNLYEFDDINTVYGEKGFEIIGSRYGDTDTPRYRVRTPRLAKRDVFQWDLTARKVLSRRWAGQLIYTFTQSLGSSNSALSGSFANDGQSQFNYGRMLTDQNHVVRVIGIWDLPTDPWTQRIGVFFVGASGVPRERFYYGATPGGDSQQAARIRDRYAYTRLPAFWDLSIRFTQQFDLRKGQLELSVEAQNITNNRAGGLIDTFQLAANNRYVLFNRQDPFRLQLGARYKF